MCKCNCNDIESMGIPHREGWGKKLYYAKRADLHFNLAQVAIANGDKAGHTEQMALVQKYRTLAEQMEGLDG